MENLIEDRHPLPEWATFQELSNGTGGAATGRIDVAAFNVWPSKKGHRIAYEVKRTRADFLRELDQPEKRAWVEEIFHETYFVASKGVCEPSEIPDGWGLLQLVGEKSDKLRKKVVPRFREVSDPPYAFVMALLRRACADLHSELDRNYRFEGTEISKEDLDKKIAEELRYQHKMLMERTRMVEKERMQFSDERKKLKAPLISLARLSSGRYGYSPDVSGLTGDAVRELFEKMKANAAETVIEGLRTSHRSLEALIQTFEAKNPEASSGS